MRGWLYLVLPCAAALLGGVSGCGNDEQPAPDAAVPVAQQRLTLDELQNPETCKTCHPKHYQEWASSMHAYAADDPVFIAMNKRGQRETKGELGKFCVQCHAPVAVRNGLTTDGLNVDKLPKAAKGVTCYFCHNAVDAGPSHVNADVNLANDTTMRGNIRNAVDPGVHGVAYSESHNNLLMKSSLLCGSCHDVVNAKNAHIERTLAEYQTSTNSFDKVGNKGGDSCQGCHMKVVETDYVAENLMPALSALVKKRDRHSHRFAAVDVALSDFPDRQAQRHDTECALTFGAFIFEVLNDGAGNFSVSIETNAGHAQPSGTSQDRRLWLEFIAYDADDKVMFQSGVIADGEPEEYPLGDPKHDGQLCLFRDKWLNEAGEDVHMFWEAATRDEKMSKVVPVATDSLTNHVAVCEYRVPGRQQPARVAMRMRMRPVGMDVMSSLVDSGDLDSAVIAEMPTFTLENTRVEWRKEDGGALYMPEAAAMQISCP